MFCQHYTNVSELSPQCFRIIGAIMVKYCTNVLRKSLHNHSTDKVSLAVPWRRILVRP